MIGIDTNVLIRLFVDDPSAPGQSDQARVLMASLKQPLMVAVPVIAEVVWVGRAVFRLSKATIIALISEILGSPNFVVAEHAAVQKALDAYAIHGADFSDHLIAALNRAAGCRTTLTFDKTAAKSPDFTLLA